VCLIAFALEAHPRYRLVLAGNRDEFHDRPADPLAWWSDAPDVLGGRDLQAGGSWMALHRTGRLAAVTNVREPGRAVPPQGGPSRGELVRGFVAGADEPLAHAQALAVESGGAALAGYRGFNLLGFAPTAGRLAGVWLSNRNPEPRPLAPGIHGLSNHLLNTPWPKVVALKGVLARALAESSPTDLIDTLFDGLADTRPVADEMLPDTGVPHERERLLSAPFVLDSDYGTRASTVVLVDAHGAVTVAERTWGPAGPAGGALTERWVRLAAP